MAETYAFENFVYQIVPASGRYRLGSHRHDLPADGEPQAWVIDPGRDVFILEAPCKTSGASGPQPVPVFLLGRKGDLFSVEFYDYDEKYAMIEDRLHYKAKYREGVLRLPARLRADAETLLGLVYDAVRAWCEIKIMREDAETGRTPPSLLEVYSVDVGEALFFEDGE